MAHEEKDPFRLPDFPSVSRDVARAFGPFAIEVAAAPDSDIRAFARDTLPDFDDRQDAFLRGVCCTDAERELFLGAEQKSDAWRRSRMHRVTGSRLGKFIGRSAWGNAQDAMREMLWDTSIPTNADMQRGIDREPITRDALLEALRARGDDVTDITEWGLYVSKAAPIFGHSTDGNIERGDGTFEQIEIKNPRRIARNSLGEGIIKEEYQMQMVLGVALLIDRYGAERCSRNCVFVQDVEGEQFLRTDFIVTPELEREVLGKAAHAYYQEYVPRALLAQEGIIRHGDTFPTTDVGVVRVPPSGEPIDERLLGFL